MNIVYLTSSLPPSMGGVERITSRLAGALTRSGHRIFYIYYGADDDSIAPERKLRIALEEEFEAMRERVDAFLKQNRIDVLVNQDQTAPNVYRLCAELKASAAVKIVYCFHLSPDYWKYLRTYTFKERLLQRLRLLLRRPLPEAIVQRQMYDTCDRFVLLSQNFAPELVRYTRIKNTDKLRSISNALSFDLPRDARMPEEKKPVVLVVARFFEKQKNLLAALRIWERIEQRGAGPWRLRLIGFGEDEPLLHAFIAEHGLKNATIEGKRDDVIPEFREASIFMMTSKYEGFGMTLTEAMQNGCVPIAFESFAAVRDIIVPGRNGVLVKPFDEKAYARALQDLMQHDEKRRALQQAALQQAEKFSLERIAGKWNELLEEL